MEKYNNQNIKNISLSEIIIDDYQRELNNPRVERIADNFDPNKAGVLMVSRRGENEYAVIDGQHRLCAMRKIGITHANCIIVDDLTYEQEADYFRKQAQNTQSLNAYALYNAGVKSKDEHYLTIQSVLDKHGYKVGMTADKKVITAINALSRIVWIFGADALDKALEYITAAWKGDPVALRREMLAGMSEFAKRFGDKVTAEQFGSRLCGALPSDIFYEYRMRTEGRLGVGSAFKAVYLRLYCSIMCERHNKGLGSNSKKRIVMEAEK